jgi:hypothetical protein
VLFMKNTAFLLPYRCSDISPLTVLDSTYLIMAGCTAVSVCGLAFIFFVSWLPSASIF